MEPIRVGGEIEAWCTSCKQEKWHVIVALVGGKPAKVECLGCHKQHLYRAARADQPTGAGRSTGGSRRAAAPPAPAPSSAELDEELRAGAASARPYGVRERFAVGDFVRHPSFGVGKVTALPAPQKMEVAFSDGRKLLMHDRSEGAAAPQLQRPAPRDEQAPDHVTDAPPKK
jgi:hypothetical protein